MKILMSADWFYPAQMGGPSNTIYWQATALAQAGHEVTVVATSRDLPPAIPTDCWQTLDCGRVIYTQNPHFYLPIKHIWYGWQAIRKADVIHVHSLFYPASIIWVLLCRLAGKPVVWSPQGELSAVALRIRPRLKRLLIRAFQLSTPTVWFHSTCPAETNQIRQHFGADAQVCTIPTMMVLPIRAEQIVAPPYLLFVGRLHPIKAIDNLLIALAASSVFRESRYSLLIAGPEMDKTYKQTLDKLTQALDIDHKVSFFGNVQGNRKQRLYANATLTILPSHSESFGNIVIESLAQGTPVVASTNTPWQVLETERAGSWVSNDPDSLRQAIDLFLTMLPSAYMGYRTRALRLAQTNYDIFKHTDRWEGFYERVSCKEEVSQLVVS
ncbi:glycosyltransferase [Spirosoma areae]